MSFRRLSLGALALTLWAVPAQAALVTYHFIEGAEAPNPGRVGAILEFASPPAFPDQSWEIDSGTDSILSFRITDSAVAPVGSYTPSFAERVTSSTGARLDSGNIVGDMMTGQGTVQAETFISGLPGGDILEMVGVGGGFQPHGDWVLAVAAAVPEPSSFLLAGTAALAGLGVWVRRRASR
jgi:hypothetical protein